MPSLLPEGKQKFFGNDGRPLVGGKIFTFAAGTNTPKPTFTDSAGTTPQTNPVILDSRGEALMFWDGAYKIQLTDALNNILWTVDNVRELVPDYRTSSTGSIVTPVGTTAQRDLNPAIGFFRFNTTTNGFEGFVSGQWKPVVFDAADVTLSSSSTVVGAVKLDNPGGATRSLTQWDGTAYAGVILNSPNGYRATTYYLNAPNCYVATDVGTGNPGFLFDAGDFMDYSRASNVWRVVMGGVAKVVSGFDTFFNYDTIVRHEVAGPSYHLVVNTTAPLDQKRWRTDHNPSVKNFYLINDADTIASPYDTINRSGMAITTRRLNESTGRLLVGQGITDDGVTALQTTSYSASNQPSLIGGSSGTIALGANVRSNLTINTRTLKGGLTVAANNFDVTVPVSGTYIVGITININNPAGQSQPLIDIYKNGVFLQSLGLSPPAPINTNYAVIFSTALSLLAGDFISFGATSQFNASNVSISNVHIIKLN